MATTRPFAYNTGTTIDGTTQIGNIAIGVSDQDYSQDPGGVKWWMGPDEELGYVIANEVPAGNHPTQVEVDAYLNFWRSTSLTDQSFLDLLNSIPITNGLSLFTNVTDALSWLDTNGYFTSYSSFGSSGFQWMTVTSVTDSTASGIGQNNITAAITQSGGGMVITQGVFNPTAFPEEYGVPFTGNQIANYNSGTFTAIFSQPVTDALVAFASIGNSGLYVPIEVSAPFTPIFGADVSYQNPVNGTQYTQLTGNEGYAIIRIDGVVTGVTFNYTVPEGYCNICFGFVDQNNLSTTPTPTPTNTVTPTNTSTTTPTPTPTPTNTVTPTNTSTTTPTPTPTPTPTSTPTGDLSDNLLQENGDSLLQENDDNILLESTETFSVQFFESGSDVILSYEGYLNLDGLDFIGDQSLALGGGVVSNYGIFLNQDVNGFSGYSGATFNVPTSFGSGTEEASILSSGNSFGVFTFDLNTYFLLVPTGYTTYNPFLIQGELVFTGQTLTSLGMNTGTYNYSWGGSSGQSFVLTIGGLSPTPTPTPTLTSTPTPTLTSTPTPTPTDTPVPTDTPTPTPTSTYYYYFLLNCNLVDNKYGRSTTYLVGSTFNISGNTCYSIIGEEPGPYYDYDLDNATLVTDCTDVSCDGPTPTPTPTPTATVTPTPTPPVMSSLDIDIVEGYNGISFDGVTYTSDTTISVVKNQQYNIIAFNGSGLFQNWEGTNVNLPVPNSSNTIVTITGDTATLKAVFPEMTPTPTPTSTPTITPTPTPTSVGGGVGAWYFYSDEGNINAGPPTTSGNAQFITQGSPVFETYNPNKSNGVSFLLFNLNDSTDTNYNTQFTNLVNNSGTISITQGGNTVTYVGVAGPSFFIDPFGFFVLSAQACTQTVTSANPFVFGDPISITFGS
jgi:hypothetical protein